MKVGDIVNHKIRGEVKILKYYQTAFSKTNGFKDYRILIEPGMMCDLYNAKGQSVDYMGQPNSSEIILNV